MHEQTSDDITACDVNIQSLEKQVSMTKEIWLRVEKQNRDYHAENVELKSKVGKIIEEESIVYGQV